MSNRLTWGILAGGVVLALVGFATRADAIPPVEPVPAVYTPGPASDAVKGLRCPVALHPEGFDRVCASVHVREDRFGNLTVRAAGTVASYNGRRQRVARPLALRVRLIGDPYGLRKAPPLYSTRRSRLGPPRIAARAQARVVAYVYRGGHWRAYLVNSEPVRVG
jgi:hypothetical protein